MKMKFIYLLSIDGFRLKNGWTGTKYRTVNEWLKSVLSEVI